MSRNPRAGGCPGLTKTEQLRQARTAAIVRDYEKKQEDAMRHQADPFKTRRRMVKPEPKKVDFHKPTMTKSMLARVKHAERFKQEYERKQEALSSGRLPKRTPAPVGGDARLGRERVPKGQFTPHISPAVTPRKTSPSRKEFEAGPSRLPSAKEGAIPKRLRPPKQTVPKKTTELAKMMNADVVQAEPVGAGPVNNIVIPPGLVSTDRTTIVSIPQPAVDTESRVTSQVANRSIQVISETLDEQDATESAVVQNRLSELQQARRDFVIAVANVGGNSINFQDESPPSFLLESPPTSPTRKSYRSPVLEDEHLQPKYRTDYPQVLAAREFIQKTKADVERREAARRMEEEFERIAAEHLSDNLLLEVPFEEGILQERNISWEEDEPEFYQYETFDPDLLERFFNVQDYPNFLCPRCRPPPGREQLHPDLWDLEDPWSRPEQLHPDLCDLEDPWCRPPTEHNVGDLIQFD